MRRVMPCLLVVLLLASIPATAQSSLPERFAMRAQAMGNVRTGDSARVEITIDRWSEQTERDRLLDILVESGPDAMKSALVALPEIGRVRVDARRSYPLQFARELVSEDGSRIVRLVTDRPIGFWEAMTNSRTSEYAFTLIELRLDANSEGDGAAMVGVEIRVDAATRSFSLVNYDSAPVRLSSVRHIAIE